MVSRSISEFWSLLWSKMALLAYGRDALLEPVLIAQ